MRELCDLSASQLGTMIRTKEVSPVEIMESCIARTKLVDGALNAMVTPAFDTALAAARAAEDAVMRGDDLGLIHGLPVAVKDLDATAGIRTTYGSILHRHDVPDADQGSVARIKAQGGIVLGKTNTPEFGAGEIRAQHAVWSDQQSVRCRKNLWWIFRWLGVALATGMAPLATGSDYGGSLRTPAGFCGIVGFRPSPGIVPIEDSGVGLHPFAVLGPMARCVDDVSLLLRAMMGFDPRDIFRRVPIVISLPRLSPPIPADCGSPFQLISEWLQCQLQAARCLPSASSCSVIILVLSRNVIPISVMWTMPLRCCVALVSLPHMISLSRRTVRICRQMSLTMLSEALVFSP